MRTKRGQKNSIGFETIVDGNKGGEHFTPALLIYALKMPIDTHRYCHSWVARPVSGLQSKLKLHFTMVFQVVAKLSRNFNIPRRERLKIQPPLVIPSPRSEASATSTPPLIAPQPLFSSSIFLFPAPSAFTEPLDVYVRNQRRDRLVRGTIWEIVLITPTRN